MADLTKKEKAEMIRTLVDAYAIGVRGGVLTPCLQDENAFRKMIGLPAAPKEVADEWDRTLGVRLPITLQRGPSEPESVTDGADGEE
jgi:hypothetical protein